VSDPAVRTKTLKELLVDHVAATAVGARLSDIVAAIDKMAPHELASLEAEMRLKGERNPMHTYDYDPGVSR
jgi:hypothetical protein